MSLDPKEKIAYLKASPQQREVALQFLSKVLGSLRASYLSYQTSHWQSCGSEFYSNHLLFQRLYESVEEQIDSLAEKMVGYFGVDSVSLSEQTQLIQHCCDRWSRIDCHHLRGIRSEQDVQFYLKSAYDGIKAAQAMTLGLDDTLMAFSNAHDSNEYLLQQVLAKPLKTASLVQHRFSSFSEGDLQLILGDRRLHWSAAEKQFHIDASDFQWRTHMSISVREPKSGDLILFSGPLEIIRDKEGDVTSWVMRGPKGTSFRVWND